MQMIVELETMLKKIDQTIRRLSKPLGISSAFKLVYKLFPRLILSSLLLALFSTVVFIATFFYYPPWMNFVSLRLLLLHLSLVGLGIPYLFATYVLIGARN